MDEFTRRDDGADVPSRHLNRDLTARALETNGIGLWQWDIATDEVWWSPAVYEALRVPPGSFAGTVEAFMDMVHPEQRATVRDTLETARHVAQPYHLDIEIVHPDGSTSWFESRGAMVSDTDGVPEAIVGTAVDITERKETERAREQMLRDEQHARTEAEAARERLAFLTTAGREMRAVLNPATVRRTAVDLAVRDLADWAVLVDEAGTQVMAAAGTGHPTAETSQCRIVSTIDPVRRVLDTGEPQLAVAPQTLTLKDADGDRIHLEASSVMAVPVRLGSHRVGSMAVGHTRTSRPYKIDDLELLAQFAETVASTVVKATLFEERSAIARVLQQSLLPPSLPTVQGLDIAAEYLPVGEGLIVGGDFYDMFRVSDGRYAFAIGDVSGKGSEAAAVTALVRHSIRAFAETYEDPAAVLVAVNEAIRTHGPSLRYCTGVFGLLTVGNDIEVQIAVGGHPLPLLVRDGRTVPAGTPGTLLGMFADVDITTSSYALEPGDALVLFTDGVIEARSADGAAFGDDRLATLLSEGDVETAAELAGRVGSAVADYQAAPTDDVAVMVLRRER